MTTPAIDRTVFNELQDTAGADFVTELVAEFFEQAPLMLAELRDAWATGSADRFRRAAHSIKSNAMTFGAASLGAMARELELGGLPADSTTLAALCVEYDRAAAALKELCHG
jgi:HPt (histidine-containing phosphotransfer) domain-containing protein